MLILLLMGSMADVKEGDSRKEKNTLFTTVFTAFFIVGMIIPH